MIRLWEVPTETFLATTGLYPFAVCSINVSSTIRKSTSLLYLIFLCRGFGGLVPQSRICFPFPNPNENGQKIEIIALVELTCIKSIKNLGMGMITTLTIMRFFRIKRWFKE